MLLTKVAKRAIRGIISETILDEVIRNVHKAGHTKERTLEICETMFSPILPPPPSKAVERYTGIVRDAGDTHLFATYDQAGCDFLVSLDKHHVLPLQGQLEGKTILAPAELLEALRKHR